MDDRSQVKSNDQKSRERGLTKGVSWEETGDAGTTL